MVESVCYGKNKRGFQETVFLLTLKHLRIKRYLGWSQKKKAQWLKTFDIWIQVGFPNTYVKSQVRCGELVTPAL